MHEDVEPEDLEYMTIPDRLRALGMVPEAVVPEGPPIRRGAAVQAPTRKPMPGKVLFTVSDVARSRGLVHTRGQHKGQVNLIAIARGTDLSYTTVMSYVNTPESLAMIYVDTIGRLCAFLECNPGDLIRYTPDLRGKQTLSERYKKGG